MLVLGVGTLLEGWIEKVNRVNDRIIVIKLVVVAVVVQYDISCFSLSTLDN